MHTVELLTVPEVAAALKISKSQVYQLIGTDQLPSVLIGTSRRISSDALAAYVASLTDRKVSP